MERLAYQSALKKKDLINGSASMFFFSVLAVRVFTKKVVKNKKNFKRLLNKNVSYLL